MNNKNKQKIRQWILIVILAVLILFFVGYLYMPRTWFFSKNIANSSSGSLFLPSLVVTTTSVNQRLILDKLYEFNKQDSGRFGQWPITSIVLSEDRGNPFIKKP